MKQTTNKTITFFIFLFSFLIWSCDNGGGGTTHTHEWEWVVTTPATTEADGLETETCKTCGETSGKTRPITKLPHVHTYSTTWSKDATQHWHECTANDGAKTDVANHTGNPCTICGYETPAVPAPKTITQETPNGLAFTGKVTIKTSDQYTAADWDAVVQKVVAAFNAAYEAVPNPGKTQFRNVFGNSAGAEIVLVNNLANNWEVRSGEFSTMYLKTGSIVTADYEAAVLCMVGNVPSIGKATPPKDRVFLA